MKCLFWGHLSSAEVKNLHQSARAKNQILDSNWEKTQNMQEIVSSKEFTIKTFWGRFVGFPLIWGCVNNNLKPKGLHFRRLHGWKVTGLIQEGHEGFCRTSLASQETFLYFQAKYWLQHGGVGRKELYSNNITQCNWIELNHLTFSKDSYIDHF